MSMSKFVFKLALDLFKYWGLLSMATGFAELSDQSSADASARYCIIDTRWSPIMLLPKA